MPDLPISGLPAASASRDDLVVSVDSGTTKQAAASSYLGLTTDADLQTSDVTTNNVTGSKHGFAPKAPSDATKFLNGADPPAWVVPAGSLFSTSYLQYRDEQAQNTSGGTFTSGAWRTRTLNTEVSDVGGFGSLASNQITLTAGTYLIAASAPARLVDRHQLRLQNVTDATTLVVGQSVLTPSGTSGDVGFASLRGIFTVAASKALELQHQGQTTQATNGFGVAANFTTEVYALLELWKIG